nr:IS3 family transposase [Prosthecochloris ethylica]
MKYQFIKEHRKEFAVRTMCRVLEVSVSSYYAWIQRLENHRAQENRQLCEAIQRMHEEKYQTYGSPRMTAELRKNGYKCSRPRVARLMQSLGIQAKTARKFKVTTDSNHQEPIAPNLLDQEFHVDQPNEVWTSDLTYVRTGAGWQYLTVILELFNREIIGYSLSPRLTAESTVNVALDMAVLHRQPPAGVILHSDRGVQYASKSFRKRLKKYGMIQSMSGKGNCYDNAVTETFFKTLKTEWMAPSTGISTSSAKASLPTLKYSITEKECILLWGISRPWSS